MFSQEIKSDYLKEIASNEFIKEKKRKRECIWIGLDLFNSINPSEDENAENVLFIYFLKIFILFIAIIIIVLPYFIQILPIIIFTYSFETLNFPFMIIILIDVFFSLFSFLGSFGMFVKGCCSSHCCNCLYHPSNWILFVVFIDLVNLILDIIIGILGEKNSDYSFMSIAFFHIFGILHNLYKQVGLYIEFKKAYKLIRKAETEVIKECINKLLKERNYYNE